MRTLIIYDSIYGNTERIAKTIGENIPDGVKVQSIISENMIELDNYELIIIGSPTHGGRPTKAIQAFLDRFKEHSFKGIRFAVFDTRHSSGWTKIFGFASDKIVKDLTGKGGILVTPPKGFIVEGTMGHLREGEVEGARQWAGDIVDSVNKSNTKPS